MSYKLSATLTGHKQDVKSIAIVNDSQLVSVSRDSTTRLWTNIASSNNDSTIVLHSPTASFINSVSYISDRGLVASGGQDAMIYLNEVGGEEKDSYQLIGHQVNVCALHYGHGQLISSSWDATAKVWYLEDFSVKLDLKGHDSSVWDCKALADNRYLTCSADKTIRLWSGNHEIKQFKGHTDVVRKLLVLPGEEQFLSCSNDCTIKLWDIATGQNLRTFVGHDSFIYDLGLLPNGNVVSTGEDRTVRVWDLNGEPIQVITLPCISIWCVDVFSNGDFAVGSSDNQIRIFTNDKSRYAPVDELVELRKAVESSAIAEQSLDNLKKTDIPSYEALAQPGKNEGSVIMVKNDEGVIEAHQWSGGQWNKIGDVVGSAGNKKQLYNGVEYDYVFDVDIKEGAPPLKLPYNANENPYVVAEKFLAENDLPGSYAEEVVRFIEQNTKGFKLEEGTEKEVAATKEPVIDPYSDAYNRQAKLEHELKVIPQNSVISYKDYKRDQLLNGLNKLNANQESAIQFSSDQISTITECLTDLNSANALKLICQFGHHIIKKWNTGSKLIGYDLIRISVTRVTTVDLINSTEAAEILLDAVISGISDASAEIKTGTTALLMMILKVVNNVIGTIFFVQLYIDPEGEVYQYNDLFKQFLKSLATIIGESSREAKLYNTTMTTVATLIYNLTVNHIKTAGLKKNPKSSSIIIEFWNKVGAQVAESNSEAAYRLSIAYGNLKYAKAYSDNVPPTWLAEVGQLYAVEAGEQRFIELASDLKKL